MNLHALFDFLMRNQGPDALRVFFDDVCADIPNLHDALEAKNLLPLHDLNLDAKLLRHFPSLSI